MKLHSTTAFLAALLLACASVPSAEPLHNSDGPTELVVNGEVLPEEAVLREMVYRLGIKELETRKLEIFVDKELKRREQSESDFVSQEEIDAVLETQLGRIEEEYEGKLTQEDVLRTNRLSVKSVRNSARLHLLFNRLFLPQNPSEWPEISREALKATLPSDQYEDFIEKMQAGYDLRKAEGQAEFDPANQQAMMFSMFLRQPIVAKLAADAKIKTAANGLPPRLVMTVGDVEVTTKEIYERILHNQTLPSIEWERTRLWLTKVTAIRQDLTEKGHYLDDETFDAIWAELEEKYGKSIIRLPQLALTFKRFPSLDSYRLYLRLMKSYENMVADELTDEALAGHLDRATRLMGLGQVDAELILLSAYDFSTGIWKEDGWEGAKARATEVAKRLAAGEDWDALLDEYSDFWDPPIPLSKQGQVTPAQSMRRNRGRFGLRNRNTLLPLVDESEYMIFLNGTSVADTVFFDQPTGAVGGPYRGVYGYYIARVKDRQPPSRSFSLEDTSQRESILQDYLQVHFMQYGEQVMRKSKITGL